MGDNELGDNKIKAISSLVSNQRSTSFEGLWMFVAEWDSVPPFPSSGRAEQEANSYQAIVITDNIATYAVYSYSCKQLEWVRIGSQYAVVGYNIGPEESTLFSPPFANHPLSTFDRIGDIACTNDPLRVDGSNLVYLVGNNSGISQRLRSDCIKRSNLDRQQFRNTFYDRSCPCSYSQATRDRRYGYISDFLYLRVGDVRFLDSDCFIDRFPPFFGDSVQLCCYDNNFFGALLPSSPMEGFSGSSLLRFHPGYDFDNYLQYDYQFKVSCCDEAGICEEYTDNRPHDTCRFYRPQRRCKNIIKLNQTIF